jgi:superfamily II DNA or RNA helicase
MHPLRDYQNETVEKIFKAFEVHPTTLLEYATGLGKTRVAVEVTRRLLPKRTLFLTDREELVWQVRDAYLSQDIDCEVEKAELFASSSLFTQAPVVIATVQTLKSGKVDTKRLKRFRPKEFKLAIYDECHSSVSIGNKAIVDYLMEGNPELRVLGLTATPDRLDKVSLGCIFKSQADKKDILFGIENGWLVEPVPRVVTLGAPDISHVRVTRKGDFNESDLAAVLEQEEPVQGLIQPTLESMFGLAEKTLCDKHPSEWREILEKQGTPLRTIVFTVSVKQAEMACNGFNRVWPGIAGWVCGETLKDSRKDLFRAFKSGDVYILCNVGVTTQGYDNPNVGMIVIARPTMSRLLFAQMIGRGTRPLKGITDNLEAAASRLCRITLSAKPYCKVMDFACVTGKHKLVTVGDLLAGGSSPEAVQRAMEKATKSKEPMKVKDIIAEEELKLQKEIEARRLAEEAKKVELVARYRYTTQQVNPFDLSDIPIGDSGIWRREAKLSPGERKQLIRGGFNPDTMPYQDGRRVVRELFWRWRNKLVTPVQIKLLRPIYGESLNYSTLKKDQASRLIESTKQNKWRRVNPSAATP